MTEVSQQRFQVFKEEIRKDLHSSDEYIFSLKFLKANGNTLLNIPNLDESGTNIDLATQD